MKSVNMIKILMMLAMLLVVGTSCGAGSLAGLANQIGNNVDDDGTPDQGSGDFGAGGGGGNSTDDDGTIDQGSGDNGVGSGGDRDRDDRDDDDDNSGSGGDDD